MPDLSAIRRPLSLDRYLFSFLLYFGKFYDILDREAFKILLLCLLWLF